jgi:hypothetical protein
MKHAAVKTELRAAANTAPRATTPAERALLSISLRSFPASAPHFCTFDARTRRKQLQVTRLQKSMKICRHHRARRERAINASRHFSQADGRVPGERRIKRTATNVITSWPCEARTSTKYSDALFAQISINYGGAFYTPVDSLRKPPTSPWCFVCLRAAKSHTGARILAVYLHGASCCA